jgi:hemerythrin-like metal-binding protein
MRATTIERLPPGNEAFDREHAALLPRLDAVLRAAAVQDAERARAALEELHRELAAHFAHEEAVMRELAYARLERHAQAHATFLADVGERLAEARGGEAGSALVAWAGAAAEWFRLHVSASDAPFAEFVAHAARRASPAAPPALRLAAGGRR